MTTHIGFIGGGNMAASMIGGLLAEGTPADHIHVSEPAQERRTWLQATFACKVYEHNQQALDASSVMILAVKPQMMQAVCEQLAPLPAQQTLCISIAAGITVQSLQGWLGKPMPLVRCMPNTPALLGCGATGLYASPEVDQSGRDLAEQILASCGITTWVDTESLIDAVTAISGSGPAYFFRIMEIITQAGTDLGLSAEQAQQLVMQTALGAARMAQEADTDLAELRRRVTSPGGTTEAALQSMASEGLGEVLQQAVQAAYNRAREMAASND